MPHVDVLHSSSFRLAAILTIVFLAAYGTAGTVAFRSIDRDLDSRVQERTELSLERLVNRYEQGGEVALIAAAEAFAEQSDPEDQLIWLGRPNGERVTGIVSPNVGELVAGDVSGEALAAEADDLYRVTMRDLGSLRLLIATNYEELDEIREHVFAVFASATAFILLIATGTAVTLARKGQRRIDRIVRTMQDVSRGRMTARVATDGAHDDLGRVAFGVNRALEQLEATVDAIRQVTTDIAHELRTPISRATILLDRARAAGSDESERDRLLARAEEEMRRVTSTFEALLRIAEIESGSSKTRFVPLSPRTIVQGLYEPYSAVAAENGDRLELGQLSRPEQLVEGDADLLTQLFANLVENSIRHCPSGTTIRIEGGTEDSGRIWMRVSDNGPGISEHDRKDVLKRFYRVEKSRSTGGTGLGLALVKAIADLHGATLRLADNGPGLIVDVVFPGSLR